MNSPTRELAEFASNLKYQDIPQVVREHTKDAIADAIGCGLFGSRTQEAKIIAKFAEERSHKEEASLWGLNSRVELMYAALGNGTSVNARELDDTHADSIQHLGSEVLPGIVAAAEKKGNVSGKDLITAVVAGYEVAIRVGLAVGLSSALRGFHTSAICGVFGGSAGSAKIFDLTTDELHNAIGIAGSFASGLQGAQYASMVKRLQPALGSYNGLLATLLAQSGFTGNLEVLDDVEYGGFCKAYADNYDTKKMTEKLGDNYEVKNIGFKIYSASRSNHSSIDAVKQIIQEHPELKPELIGKITIRCSSITYRYGWITKIETPTSAQLSIPYCVAAMICERDAFIDQFTEEKIRDNRILEMVSKTEMIIDPEIDKLGVSSRWNVRVQITTVNGKILEAFRDQPTGSIRYPIGHDGIRDKFIKLTTRVYPVECMKTLFHKLETLESLNNIKELCLNNPI